MSTSEVELQTELNDSRRVRLAGDNSKRPTVECCVRGSQLRPVEGVEKFGSELHLLRLSDLEVLLQHHVEVDQVRSPQISDSGVSK